MSEVIYRRARVSRRAWTVPFVVWAVAAVLLLLTVRDGVGTSDILAAVVPPGIAIAVWLLTLWSMNHYGSTVITRETLHVGRDTVPVDLIDRDWVAQVAAARAPGLLERLGRSAATIRLPGVDELDPASGRLLGGAYGGTLGGDAVLIRLTDGTRYTVDTGDREGLLAGLLTATAKRD